MNDLDIRKLDLITHFMDGAWDIFISDEDAHLILAEIPWLDIYEYWPDECERGQFLAKKIEEIPIQDQLLYYKTEYDFLYKCFNKLTDKLENICEDPYSC